MLNPMRHMMAGIGGAERFTRRKGTMMMPVILIGANGRAGHKRVKGSSMNMIGHPMRMISFRMDMDEGENKDPEDQPTSDTYM